MTEVAAASGRPGRTWPWVLFALAYSVALFFFLSWFLAPSRVAVGSKAHAGVGAHLSPALARAKLQAAAATAAAAAVDAAGGGNRTRAAATIHTAAAGVVSLEAHLSGAGLAAARLEVAALRAMEPSARRPTHTPGGWRRFAAAERAIARL